MSELLARVTDKETGLWAELWYDEYCEDANPIGESIYDGHIEMLGKWSHLGNPHPDRKNSEEDLADYIKTLVKEGGVGLAIRAYDHSQVAFTIGHATEYPFNDQWDSYWAGWAYYTAEEVKTLFGGDMRKAASSLEELVKLLTAWANGQCYGYKCFDSFGEEVDSSWGFWDTYDNSDGLFEAMADNAPEEYEELIRNFSFGHIDPLDTVTIRRVPGHMPQIMVA